jgi:hypothetical protein
MKSLGNFQAVFQGCHAGRENSLQHSLIPVDATGVTSCINKASSSVKIIVLKLLFIVWKSFLYYNPLMGNAHVNTSV